MTGGTEQETPQELKDARQEAIQYLVNDIVQPSLTKILPQGFGSVLFAWDGEMVYVGSNVDNEQVKAVLIGMLATWGVTEDQIAAAIGLTS